MPNQPSNDILQPKFLVIPKYSTTQRDLLVAEIGTIIFNTTTATLNVCDVERTAGSGSWGVVTLT